MRYFTFMGKSCLSILPGDNPLALVSLDKGVDEIPGSEKEVVTGNTSIYKTIANEYGNMYDDPLEFEYSLIKINDDLITPAEQRMIEKWLTSPKLSQYLQLFELLCDKNGAIVEPPQPSAIYCGTFIQTEWIPCAEGYMGVNFTFQCDSPYAWRFYENTTYSTGNDTALIYTETDEPEEYIYPKIEFKAINDGEEQILHDVEFEFIHLMDENRGFKMKTQIDKTIVMDCRACRITDNAGNLFSYDDLGWQDVGKIYWPRLVEGYNAFRVITDRNVTIEMKISYMSPYKIVGGWL